MLPKKVADDLKYGNKVDPESFESATVFFRLVMDIYNRVFFSLREQDVAPW